MTANACPSCGFEFLSGDDRCLQCLHSLMQVNRPEPQPDDRISSAMMTAPVSELLTGDDLLVANKTDSVQKVVEIFREQNRDCVLVYDQKHLVGILSNRTLLREVAGQYEDLSKVTMEEVMTHKPEFIGADDPIAYAVNLMATGNFRHVPVLASDGTPISILNAKDVLDYLTRTSTESSG